MATAVNPSTSAGISIGSGLGSVTDWLRQITIRITSSRNSHGSGVIWRSEGLIVTNAHVAGSQVHEIEFENGRRLEAWLLARDQKLDLAVLAVSSRDLQAASIRSARTLRPGEMVIAVGNPLDDVGAVSTGIVHCAVGKLPWVEADIRLAPGNSGGPLADAHGNVVGINSMIVDGLGWAVSSDGVQRFLESVQLAEVV